MPIGARPALLCQLLGAYITDDDACGAGGSLSLKRDLASALCSKTCFCTSSW